MPRPRPDVEPAPPSSETPPTRQVPKSDLRQLGSAPPTPRPMTDSVDPEDGSDSSWPGSAVRERIPADSFLPPPFVEGQTPRRVGRCEIHAELAQGGMATVYLGRWVGAGGFAKTVAIKALHRQYARDPEFVRMFLDEARVVARVRHPNVMTIVDLIEDDGELFIVMEYAHSVTLAQLLRQLTREGELMPVPIALRVLSGVLSGLHAAHEARDARGKPMGIIHRDVSPENVLVCADGYARLIDFGIASALGRASATERGQVKGKLGYLAPEQILGEELDRRVDVFSSSVVLWNALTGKRLFRGDNLAAIARKILEAPIPPPSKLRPVLAPDLDDIVMRGLARNRNERWPAAEPMAEALERVGGLASAREVGEWVCKVAQKRLAHAANILAAVESAPLVTQPGDAPSTPGKAAPDLARDRRPTVPARPLPADDAAQPAAAEVALATTNGRRRKRLLTAAAAGAGACAALLVAAATGALGGRSPDTTAPAASASAAPPAARPSPTPTPLEPALVPSGAAGASADASASASASASMVAGPTTTSTGPKPPKPPKPPPPQSKLPNDI
ncbi:MAG: serine/threonine protein kinase [Polyangiaceae bacterium]|nr:serine/threonine protein kinase [Polyangiaceae bacterium]